MAIEKIKNFNDGYGNFDGSAKPTTFADIHEFMENQNNVLLQLAAKCWQPGTSYAVGDIVSTSSMGGYFARCTKAGKSSDAEPTWKKDSSTTDGTVTWAVYKPVSTDMISDLVKPLIASSIEDTVKPLIASMFLARMPVGTIIETEQDVNPGTYIGGTWEKMPAGYVTISAGTYTETQDGNAVTYEFKAGNTYGEAAHKLTVGEMPSHGHMVRTWNNVTSGNAMLYRDGKYEAYTGGAFKPSGSYSNTGYLNSPQNGTGDPAGTTDGTGGNSYHNILQPSIATYRFKRIS